MAYDDHDWEVQTVFEYAGKRTECVLAFGAVPSAADPNDVRDQVYRFWGAASCMLSIMSNQATTVEVKVTRLDQGIPPVTTLASGLTGDVQGAESSDIVAVQVAFINTLKTPIFGRSGRGRIYVPYVAENHLSSPRSQWGSADPDLFDSVPQNALGAVSDGTYVSGVLAVNSRKNSVLNGVTAIVPRVYFGTQRRRAEAFE